MTRLAPARVEMVFLVVVPLLLAPRAARPADAPPLLAPESTTASQPTSQPVQTGRFQLTFTEKSPQSDTTEICKRMGWRVEPLKEFGKPMDYDPAKESYEVYVPASYTGSEPYGLFVWISPGHRGDVPQQFYEVLDRHKLIAIGANNAGNDRELWNRMSVAMDAPFNMKKRYNLDPKRMYVSGASGGGRTSSRIAMLFPEVFNGGYYQIGVDFYKVLWVDKEGGKMYKQAFQRAARGPFEIVRDNVRHVLLTGETDPNRAQTKLTYEQMKKDGFKHVTYLEQPGLGHQPPSAEWFEKGIVALDEAKDSETEEPTPKGKGSKGKGATPVAKRPVTPTTRPAVATTRPTAVVTTRPATATTHPTIATTRPVVAATHPTSAAAATQEAEDLKMLKLAKLYVNNRLYSKARAKLKELVEAYPKSASAKEAEGILKQIGKE
jgi:hypothetical protein